MLGALLGSVATSQIIAVPGGATGGTWAQVGNAFAVPDMTSVRNSLTGLSSTRVALSDTSVDTLTAYDFDGTNWSKTGNSLSIAGMGNDTVAALDSSSVAFYGSSLDTIIKYSFDGTDWSQVGNAFTMPTNTGNGAMTALDSSTVAFIDTTTADLRTYSFDGTDWSLVGNALNISAYFTGDITALSSTRIAMTNGSSNGTVDDYIATYDFDGTDWSQVGNELSFTGNITRGLTALSSTRVVSIDPDTTPRKLFVYDFDGTNWTEFGTGFGVLDTGIITMATLNATDIAYADSIDDELKTFRFTES